MRSSEWNWFHNLITDFILDMNFCCDCELEFNRIQNSIHRMRTMNDESMLKYGKPVAHVT